MHGLPSSSASGTAVDAVVVGAGIGGLYAVHRLTAQGNTVIGLEGAEDVGGVWLHNAYPGARVDIEAYFYSYMDPEIYPTWQWSDRLPPQPEILAYLRHYADHYGLRRSYRFSTWLEKARWNEDRQHWTLRTSAGDVIEARHVLLATGQLSKSRTIPFAGAQDFRGSWLETAHWPKEPVDFAGKRVAVIGTGSSGVQVITEIAKEAASLHVFQRTPNYVVPSQRGPIDRARYAAYADRLPELWDDVMSSSAAYLAPTGTVPATQLTPREQLARMEQQWAFGGLAMNFCFPDQRTSLDTNTIVSDFVRGKIRDSVEDPDVAAALAPVDYPIGTRRLAVCNDYYETYNRDNVRLVDLKQEPITHVTPNGIATTEGTYEFDAIISAMGFDAFTGAVDEIDLVGTDGRSPGDLWKVDPCCYLGLMLPGFPNMYFLTGPGSPSVLVNFNVHNVFHVDTVTDLMQHMAEQGLTGVEPTWEAHEEYKVYTQTFADGLLRKKVDNYMSYVNPDGSRFFVPFAGGWSTYVDLVRQTVADGYPGFRFLI